MAIKPVGAVMIAALCGTSACGRESGPKAPEGVACVAREATAKSPPDLPVAAHLDSAGAPRDQQRKARAALLRPICREGQVPAIRPRLAKTPLSKGNPLLGPDSVGFRVPLDSAGLVRDRIRKNLRRFEDVYHQTARPDTGRRPPPPNPSGTCDGVVNGADCYYYGSAGVRRGADGGGMTTSIQRPAYVNTGGSGHTLNEIAVQGDSADGDIVELGWNVSSDQYGDADPHLFVFHWEQWAPTCYDGCGWKQYSATYYPAQNLSALIGNRVYVGYVYYQGNWWAWFDNQWLGYFPGTEWDGKYSRASLLQWFGEVASKNGVPPQTDMGNGALPAVTTAADMQTLCDVVAADWVCWYRDQQALGSTVPADYDIGRVAFGATRYGGPGQ
jgi:neprosin-like protein